MSALRTSEELIQSKPEGPAFPSHWRDPVRPGGVLAQTPPFFWFTYLIRRKIDLWIVSDRLDLNPSTVQKILKGCRVSRSVIKKIEKAFQESLSFNEQGVHRMRPESRRSTVERFREVYRLYQKERSLRTVGMKLGLSRERVRQLLKKGSQIGLFRYRPSKRPALTREKILASYGQFLTLRPVARANRISMSQLARLIALHQITKTEFGAIRRQEGRRRCLEQYLAVAARLGHHPTTTELLESKSTRSLMTKIRRLWKSLEAFRRESKITPGTFAGGRRAASLLEVDRERRLDIGWEKEAARLGERC